MNIKCPNIDPYFIIQAVVFHEDMLLFIYRVSFSELKINVNGVLMLNELIIYFWGSLIQTY